MNTEQLNQLNIAIDKGLISHYVADCISQGVATMDELDECMTNIVEYDCLEVLWRYLISLTLDSARTRLNNLKSRIEIN